jgi:putative ATPase
LAETTVYLAASPKSNSAYLSIDRAIAEVRESGNLPVPLHLRNAPTALMRRLGYGKNYKYAHDYEGNFAEQDYLPKEIKDKRFWEPQANPQEGKMAEHLKKLREKEANSPKKT